MRRLHIDILKQQKEIASAKESRYRGYGGWITKETHRNAVFLEASAIRHEYIAQECDKWLEEADQQQILVFKDLEAAKLWHQKFLK